MDRLRRTVAVIVLAFATAVWTPSVAGAEEKDVRNKLDFHGVDTYFSVTYKRGSGNCANAYKITHAHYEFHRDYAKRSAFVKKFRLAEQNTWNCAGTEPLNRVIDESHWACFGCNGKPPNWSRSYYYAPSWPLQLPGEFAVQHGLLRVRVYYQGDSQSNFLGAFCRGTFRFGGNPC
jgi:hypothetical protein